MSSAQDSRRPGLTTLVAQYQGGSIEGWPSGIDNRSSDADVPRSSLRDAVNCDILSSGKPRRRRGLRQVIADAGAHSVFATDLWMVWATATTLCICGPGLTKTVLLTDARLRYPLSFVEVNKKIYFSNEYINGTITQAGAYEPWGIVAPTTAPIISAPAGDRYIMATCTFVLASGEESGAPLGYKISCTDTPVITIAGIPQSSDARVAYTRVYLTALDGQEFYAAIDVPAGQVTASYSGYTDVGPMLSTQFCDAPPPGQLLSAKNGVIHIASGNNVFHTVPLYYGLCELDEGYFAFPSRVTMIAATDDGLFVSADQTYFIKSATTDLADLHPILPYKAIEGAFTDIPESNDVMWFSERGFVRGSPEGEMVNLTDAMIAVDKHTRGAMGIVEYNGHRAVVAIMRDCLAANPLVSADFRAADV